MEVSGKLQKTKKTYSLSRGSAENLLLFCIPCLRDGERVRAKGYCTSCNEHLCEACYKHHSKPAPSRNHVLLDQDSMPTTPSVLNAQDDFDRCDDHEDENLKFYCKDHDIVVCSICETLNHRLCQLDYIPKLSKDILEGEELNELLAEIKELEKVYKLGMKKPQDEMKAISLNHDEIIKSIHQFRKEINLHLTEMEKRIIKEADRLFDMQHMALLKLSKDVEGIIEEMIRKQLSLSNLIKNKCINKLFVEMKEAKKLIEGMKTKEKLHSKENNLQFVKFVKNIALVDMLEKHKQLGELICTKTPVNENSSVMKDASTPSVNKTLNLQVVDDIDMISSAWDEDECRITGLEVIQSDKIVFCDYTNKKVKCYDTIQKRIISEVQLNNGPRDVAAITYDEFVVTVPINKSIYFMSLTNGCISSDHRVNINEECWGIAYSRDKLVVSCNFSPGCILVMDRQGKLLQKFSGDNHLFCYPWYITVNTAGTAIYVSDWGGPVMAVKQLDRHGIVINTYTPAPGGDEVRGICELNDGTFLVCLHQDSDTNLLRISNRCQPCKIMRSKIFDSWYPVAVAYCKITRKLYVSYSKELFAVKCRLKVFKMDWC